MTIGKRGAKTTAPVAVPLPMDSPSKTLLDAITVNRLVFWRYLTPDHRVGAWSKVHMVGKQGRTVCGVVIKDDTNHIGVHFTNDVKLVAKLEWCKECRDARRKLDAVQRAPGTVENPHENAGMGDTAQVRAGVEHTRLPTVEPAQWGGELQPAAP